MAAMTTVITPDGNSENRFVYQIDGHTTDKPKLLVYNRKPKNASRVASDSVQVVFGTEDAQGAILPSNSVIEIQFRRNVDGIAADEAALLAVAVDVLGSDEFQAIMNGQTPPGA